MWEEDLLQIRAAFDEVFTLSGTERQRYLAAHYAHDVAVRSGLERLFAHEHAAVDFLEAPVLTGLRECWRHTGNNALSGSQLGPYRIERELGRGGMGVVYLAVRDDDVFRKQVAIKLVWPGLRQTTERFRQERQMLADLEHPHIARLLDGGTTSEGWQYLVMEYVEGVSLSAYCQQHNLSVRARLDLFLDICAAVQHAHQHLIIHRDLKPSNILVTAEGQVKLLDFGIAKALDASAYASDLSLPGTHLMTPEYASPEQLTGAPVTTASDVYSLGVVLFELLTGQRPFQFASRQPHEVARVLSQHAPPLMSQVRKAEGKKNDAFLPSTVYRLPSTLLRGDLDNIVARALQPKPDARYASVAALREDLRRHLHGEVVQARKPTLAYRANRFVRRHKAAFSAVAVVVLFVGLWLAFFLRPARQAQVQAREQRRQLYAAEIKQAQEAWKNNDPLQLQTILAHWLPQAGEEDLRGFEWGYLQRLLNASTRTIALPAKPGNVAYFAAEDAVAVGLDDETVRVFDATTGQQRLAYTEPNWTGYVLHSTKDMIRLHEQRTFVVFDLFTQQVKYRYTYPHGRIQSWRDYLDDPPRAWCYVIAEESGALSIVDIATNTERFRLPGQGRPLSFYNFLTTHNLLVTVTDERNIRVDDITGRTPPRFFTEPSILGGMEITVDGQMLLLRNQASLYVRDIKSGRLLHTYPAPAQSIAYHALDHTGQVIAIGQGDGTIELCAFPTFRKLRTLTGHTRPATWLGFSNDNQALLSNSADHSVRLWDRRTGQEKVALHGHISNLVWLDYSPVNGRFVTASEDQTLRIWDWAEVTKPSVLQGATDHILTVAFSPDGKHVAAGGKDNTAILHNADTGAQQILRGHQNFVYVTRFSPDGRWLVTGSDDGTAKVWEVATGREINRFVKGTRTYHDGVRSLAFLADQYTIAFGGNDGTLTLWNAVENRVSKQFVAHTKEVLSVSLSPDGKLLATASMDGTAKLWDTTTWQERAILPDHRGYVWSAVFSPDGQQLATASQDQTIKLWDVKTRQLLRTLTGHSDEIFQIAFTPDGTRLASASNDHTVKLWNPQTGQELLTLRDHTNEVWGVAFSPDGRTMLTGSWDKTLRLRRTSVQYGER
jgi:WD40 repeat protein/serine/threonine protein kinase